MSLATRGWLEIIRRRVSAARDWFGTAGCRPPPSRSHRVVAGTARLQLEQLSISRTDSFANEENQVNACYFQRCHIYSCHGTNEILHVNLRGRNIVSNY